MAHARWHLLTSLRATGAAVASVSAVADPGERVLGAAEWPEPLVVVATCPTLDASAVVAEWAARSVDSGPVTVPVVIRPELAAGAHRDLHFLVGRFHGTGAGVRCSRPTAWPGYECGRLGLSVLSPPPLRVGAPWARTCRAFHRFGDGLSDEVHYSGVEINIRGTSARSHPRRCVHVAARPLVRPPGAVTTGGSG